MDLVLDIATSSEFWRRCYPAGRLLLPSDTQNPTECAVSKKDVQALCPDWVAEELLAPNDGVLHALAFGKADKRRSKVVVTHAWSGPIPEGSFYMREPHVYVESPEFMFLHAANVLELRDLIAFGDELCGRYSFDEREKRGFRKRGHPLLNKARLERYLQRATGCSGIKQARVALRHIVDNSASPMETFDEMTMCLPYRLGGYALTRPIMNEEIKLTPKAARIAGKGTCYLDIGYKTFSLDIEHHGKCDHSEEWEICNDRARVNALEEMGLEVIELTADQVRDPIVYEYIIQRVARKIGKRLRKDALGKTEARMQLRKRVYAWNRRSGRVR